MLPASHAKSLLLHRPPSPQPSIWQWCGWNIPILPPLPFNNDVQNPWLRTIAMQHGHWTYFLWRMKSSSWTGRGVLPHWIKGGLRAIFFFPRDGVVAVSR